MRYRTFLLVCFVSLIGVEAVRADATTDYNLAIELYSQQRWQLAVESCEEFVNKYPTHARVPDARLYWAQSLVHLRQFAPAREQYVLYLKTAKPDHPDRALATYRAGECSYFLGDLKQAQDWLSRFLQSYPENNLEEWAIVYLGETDFRLNQFSEAKEAFEQSLNKYPNGRLVEDARYGLGRTLVRLGQTDQAIITFEEVASKKESRRAPEAMFAIGSTYFDSGEFREAAKAFAQLLEDYPSSSLVSTAKLNAGYAHFSLKAYQTAITLFEEAAQDPEQALTAIYWKGLSEKGLLDYAKAVTTFADSLEKAPTQPLAENLTYQWGDAEFRLANYDKAVTLLKSVFEKWPQGEYADDALHLATEAAFQRKDLPLARQLHQQFITQYPKSPLVNVQNLLSGRILVASGDQAKSEAEQRPFYLQALGVFEQVESRSNAPETRRQALFQLARTNERLGNDADVVTQLGRLLSAEAELSRSERYDAHLLRANASLRQGSAAEARQDYQRCQDLAESDEEQRQALTGLAGTQTSLLE
ncbi:MAG: tetratricopeptide repeat protein, partial [Planctomycetaceae bacterium]|nr:tetratricopeptide repeat protein [Planctomycetaceae bacterium]